MGLVVALVAVLVASTLAVVQFLQLQDAQRQLEQAGRGGDPDEDGGLGKLFEDLLDEVLGEGGIPGASQLDLFRCLGDGAPAQPAPPVEGGLQEQVRFIARTVERIRQLQFEEAVEPEFLSAEESADRVQEAFLEDYTAEVADTETRILETLGAVPRGIDLRETRAEVLGAQVVGFYVPETGELVVRTAGRSLGPLDRVTLAHELEHALADQVLGLPIPLEPKPGREDRDLAAVALIEGDATLTMQRFAFTLPFQDQLELADPALAAEAEAGLASVPHYLRQELIFPYQEGLSFVCGLYAEGGWEAVNRAYAEPPTTSAQILFPDRFADGEDAVDPSDPGRLSGRWSSEGVHEIGAANLLWLFQAPGGDPGMALANPLAAASSWAGGEAHLWSDGDRTAMGLVLAERPGEDRLCQAVMDWYRASFADDRETGGTELLEAVGAAQSAEVVCTADEVTVGIGPTLGIAETLTGTA